jgi:hypothetical protein
LFIGILRKYTRLVDKISAPLPLSPPLLKERGMGGEVSNAKERGIGDEVGNSREGELKEMGIFQPIFINFAA